MNASCSKFSVNFHALIQTIRWGFRTLSLGQYVATPDFYSLIRDSDWRELDKLHLRASFIRLYVSYLIFLFLPLTGGSFFLYFTVNIYNFFKVKLIYKNVLNNFFVSFLFTVKTILIARIFCSFSTL